MRQKRIEHYANKVCFQRSLVRLYEKYVKTCLICRCKWCVLLKPKIQLFRWRYDYFNNYIPEVNPICQNIYFCHGQVQSLLNCFADSIFSNFFQTALDTIHYRRNSYKEIPKTQVFKVTSLTTALEQRHSNTRIKERNTR